MVSMSVVATVTRATSFAKDKLRELGLTSGTASKEFGAAIDLTDPVPPSLPIAVNTPDLNKIEFYIIQVTSGTIVLREVSGSNHANYIDKEVSGTIIASGQNIYQLLVVGILEGTPFVEILGMGSRV